MIQRILRGRAFYVALVVFIVILYVKGPALLPEPGAPQEPAGSPEAMTVFGLAQPLPARTVAALQEADRKSVV